MEDCDIIYNGKKETNWRAVSNLINDCWMYVNRDFDDASNKLYHLLEVLDDFVDTVRQFKDV